MIIHMALWVAWFCWGVGTLAFVTKHLAVAVRRFVERREVLITDTPDLSLEHLQVVGAGGGRDPVERAPAARTAANQLFILILWAVVLGLLSLATH